MAKPGEKDVTATAATEATVNAHRRPAAPPPVQQQSPEMAAHVARLIRESTKQSTF